MASSEALLAGGAGEPSAAEGAGAAGAAAAGAAGGTTRKKRGSNVLVGDDGAVRFRGETADGLMTWDGRPYDLVDWEAEAELSTCTRLWRAKWNLKPRGPRWLPEVIRLTWYLQVIGLVVGIHDGVDGDLAGPFFYSRTSCCGAAGTPTELPSHFDVHYPKTLSEYHVNVSMIKACDLPELARKDKYWSRSAYCPSWDYVKTFTQKLNAGRSVVLSTISLVALPMGAGVSDALGRKPMIFFTFVMGLKSLVFNTIESTDWVSTAVVRHCLPSCFH
eukprot:SAG22_NODE_1695_length_3796_cov_3.361915_1_plen_275_part_00